MKFRFAPSPTGLLHIGNIRTALVNWLYARKTGGCFLLRMDDTDEERSKEIYEQEIYQDMKWLGLTWDEFARQKDRLERYEAAKKKLIEAGRLYPCYETTEELEFKRKLQLGRGEPPIYDRAALKLSEAQKQTFESEGRRPHWRFLLEQEPIEWQDEVRGKVQFHGRDLSDPILIRENGLPTYTLSSVVDDGELGVTHILRGEDHVSNTAVQVQLFQALGFGVPGFAHLALIKTTEGKLSKRLGGGDIMSLREEGYEPMAILSLLAKLGTSDPVEACPDLETLVQGFDISKFGRAPAHFSEEELERVNHKLLALLPYQSVKAPLEEAVGQPVEEAFWYSVRGNLKRIREIREWWDICHGEVAPDIEDAGFMAQAAELLPPEPWDESSWPEWTAAIKKATGRKGKALFLPLRKALTGRDSGPELKVLMPLIGRDKVLHRLRGEKA